MDEASKQQHIANVKKANPAFAILELINITENNNANDKGFMVIVDLKASNNDDLTTKLKSLFIELNVKNVNYNNVLYKTQDFNY